jgi:tetratricopeptide (TPR) repeat protein
MNPLSTAEFFIQIRQFDKAKIVLDLLKPYASNIQEIDQLGKCYAEIREFNDTLELAHRIYALVNTKESKFDSRVNIIRAHLNLNQPKEALVYIDINERENPTDHPNLMDKAMAYFLLDRKEEGEKILRNILKEPHTDDVDFRVNFNLGTYDLRKGNFKEGLRHVLLDGRKLNLWHEFKFPKEQLWEGNPQPGKTIVLCAEGGIGDEIISVRFMKHFKDVGMDPIWYTDRKDISSIFERNGFKTISNLVDIPKDWLWTYSMPSPTYLDLEEDELWYGSYLKPLKQNKNILPNSGKKKIGIKCMGNPKYDQDLHRTIPFEELIYSIPKNYEIYSFHIDEDFHHPRVIQLKDRINSWDDTLDLLDQMDLVVSSCTSLIHAAGAMGKKSAVVIPILTYYTWAKLGYHTKWYDHNLTIFRQCEHDNWRSPLKELKAYLNG